MIKIGKIYSVDFTKIRAGYYAAASFMDAQFGKIIQGLYEYDLWENTIVSFVGDHGMHLGEQGGWGKISNFEVAVRVPLMFRIPGMNEGKKSDILVEMLDMFPTLVDAAGIGFTDNITQQLEGKSLLDIIDGTNDDHEYYAYSQYPRGGKAPDFNVMGVSLRTNEWRYTEWLDWNPGSNTSKPYPIWGGTNHGIELYNHSNITTDENDMNGYDNYNLAYEEGMQSTVKQLHDILVQTWDNQSWSINKQYRQSVSIRV